MKKVVTGNNAIDLDLLLWLLLGLSLVVIPHVMRMPIWVGLSLAVMIVWRFMSAWRGWPLPGHGHRLLSILKQLVAVAVFIAVYISFVGKLGRDAGITLLVVLLGLKLIEMNSRRDVYITCFLGYFLIITNFFFSQTIPTALLMLVVITIMTATLIRLNEGHNSMRIVDRLRLAATMLLQAIPVLILAFILFPRINGPLWGVQANAYTTSTGLSETMSPGNISKLTTSDAPAFRVKFEGEIPHPKEQYWRGPVFWHTDGRTWSAGTSPPSRTKAIYTGTKLYTYTVTLEPHNKHWLFALEMPNQSPRGSRITDDLQLLSRKAVKQRMRYDVTSSTDFQIRDITESEFQRALQLPYKRHQDTIALAEDLRRHASQDLDIVQAGLNYFRDNGFVYSLTPPLLDNDPVDEFLFETRQGFCEHYAAAFTIMMRAAGVPARVVTGYQGGEFNPIGDYLLVRQRDAHAWVEVWLESRGWTRVDPTSVVSPNRIEQGMQTIADAAFSGIPLGLNENATLKNLLRSVSNTLDAINNGWNQWVLGYGPDRQRRFLRNLGLRNPSWSNMVMTLVGTTVVVMLVVAWWLFLRRRRDGDPVRAAWDRFRAKLKRAGVTADTSIGPLDLCRLASGSLPSARQEIETITQLYIALRYADSSVDSTRLYDLIKQFRPEKA